MTNGTWLETGCKVPVKSDFWSQPLVAAVWTAILLVLCFSPEGNHCLSPSGSRNPTLQWACSTRQSSDVLIIMSPFSLSPWMCVFGLWLLVAQLLQLCYCAYIRICHVDKHGTQTASSNSRNISRIPLIKLLSGINYGHWKLWFCACLQHCILAVGLIQANGIPPVLSVLANRASSTCLHNVWSATSVKWKQVSSRQMKSPLLMKIAVFGVEPLAAGGMRVLLTRCIQAYHCFFFFNCLLNWLSLTGAFKLNTLLC